MIFPDEHIANDVISDVTATETADDPIDNMDIITVCNETYLVPVCKSQQDCNANENSMPLLDRQEQKHTNVNANMSPHKIRDYTNEEEVPMFKKLISDSTSGQVCSGKSVDKKKCDISKQKLVIAGGR